MSIKMILHALETKVGSTASKMVLIKLCDQANDDGECWPSITSIARHCEMSRRSVINHLNKLADDGFIERSHRADKSGRTTSNTYRIILSASAESAYADEKSAHASADPARASAKSAPSASAKSARTQGAESARSLRLTCQGNDPVSNEPVNGTFATSSKPAGRPALKARSTAVALEGDLIGKDKSTGIRAWDAYANAYLERYGVEPVRNAKTNAQLAQLAKRLPADEICEVVCWYVRSSNAFYVRDSHGLGLLLRDCEGLRTQWATNSRMTSTEARQMDEHESTYESVRWVRENMDRLRKLRAEGKI